MIRTLGIASHTEETPSDMHERGWNGIVNEMPRNRGRQIIDYIQANQTK
jgi:hypothetical protein